MLLLEYSPTLTIPHGLHKVNPFASATNHVFFEEDAKRRDPWDALIWSGMTFGFEALRDAENNAAIGAMEAIYAMAAYRRELLAQQLTGDL